MADVEDENNVVIYQTEYDFITKTATFKIFALVLERE